MSESYKVVDLFAGAGGMTLGFARAGFEPVMAVEHQQDFARTYEANFGKHVICCDIAQLVPGDIGVRADVVIGGPPCQGFSNLTGNKSSDPRRTMWRYYMDVVESTACKVFVIENVPNLVRSPEGQEILDAGRSLGYFMTAGVRMASNFGVAQNRRRAFIVGSRFEPLEIKEDNGRRATVRDAFKGIPAKPLHAEIPNHPAAGSDLHVGRNPTELSLKRYSMIPEGGNRFDLMRLAPEITPPCWLKKTSGGTDIFGRLVWDRPAHCTIRCEFYKPEKGRYLHPQEDRPITHWEAARLQSFPDDFRWCGTKTRIAIQIGNAVPPLLAEAVAEEVMAHLKRHQGGG